MRGASFQWVHPFNAMAEYDRQIQRVDVVILGSGPAGAAAALTLARVGLSTLVIERSGGPASSRRTWKIGESLPPAAKPVLQSLGLWESFIHDGHLPSYGNRSAWGSQHLHDNDFIFDPNGTGWHLDRSRFDTMMLNAALAAGAMVSTRTRLTKWHYDALENWQLDLQSIEGRRQVQARFVVDATGRSGWFARCQTGRRQYADNLVAIAGLLTPIGRQRACDACTLIEATYDGWWYRALLPDGRLVIVLMTDADLAATARWHEPTGWWDQLQRTEHVRNDAKNYRLTEVPRVVCARSSRSQCIGGGGWLAIGDAAISTDPLAAQGITAALVAGRRAAQAIESCLTGDASAVEDYVRSVEAAYTHYLEQCAEYYGLEPRWANSPFWRRRASPRA
jgi:flavin-dependent dehydrogenase